MSKPQLEPVVIQKPDSLNTVPDQMLCRPDTNESARLDALNLSINGHHAATPSSIASEDSDDYDKLSLDATAVVQGSHGGGLESTPDSSDSEGQRARLSRQPTDELHTYGRIQIPSPRSSSPEARAPPTRRKSVQIVVEKNDKKGRYILRADDQEIREILRRGLEQGAEGTKRRQRTGFRDLVFTRQFTTFDRQNPTGSGSAFFGFFTLFWLCLAMLLVRIAAQNWRQYGSVFGGAELLRLMFDREVIVMGITDAVMTVSTLFGFGLQKLIAKGWLTWNGSGWIIQNVWQTLYLGAFIGFTFYRQWPWTHTIFIVLHSLVYLMKQHSYAFYNGYLSQVYRRRRLLQQKLKQLENTDPVQSPTADTPKSSFPTSSFESSTAQEDLRRRRHSVGIKSNTNLASEQSSISAIASAIESGSAIDADQLVAFRAIVADEIASLTEELKGKCSQTTNYYPSNLTPSNFTDWTVLPTLVYELEYPRQDRTNWRYVVEKTAATFGCIWIMMVISQAYIYPAVKTTVEMKEAGMSLAERSAEFPWILLDMLFPLLLEQLLSWYVIWECVLNVLAEVTGFADRGFYGDWWNSVSFDQYARDWNRPVHTFLLRHVYHSSISAFKLGKSAAMFGTFFLSACVHELVMFCLFHKLRGYLFMFQLLQLPLASLSRTRFMKGRTVLGNLIFWFGLFVGPSLITSLYLIV